MSRTRKNYPPKFKAKVVLAALRDESPISELAIQFGIHSTVIHRWKKEAINSIEAGFSGKLEKQKLDNTSHIKELHAKIGQLTVERDFLVEASNQLGLGGVKK